MQTRRRHQIAHEIHKIEGVMHAVVYEREALEAKWARDSSHKRFLKGAWSAQRAKRTSNGATRATKSDKNRSYKGHMGIKKVRILMQYAWNLFEKCARHRGRGALFEKSQQILKEKGAASKASRHGTTGGTRNAHPRKAMNRKCLFFHKNLQVFSGNKCSQLGIFRVDWGAKRDVFWRFYVHATFKIMLATEGGKQICKKNKNSYKKHV